MHVQPAAPVFRGPDPQRRVAQPPSPPNWARGPRRPARASPDERRTAPTLARDPAARRPAAAPRRRISTKVLPHEPHTRTARRRLLARQVARRRPCKPPVGRQSHPRPGGTPRPLDAGLRPSQPAASNAASSRLRSSRASKPLASVARMRAENVPQSTAQRACASALRSRGAPPGRRAALGGRAPARRRRRRPPAGSGRRPAPLDGADQRGRGVLLTTQRAVDGLDQVGPDELDINGQVPLCSFGRSRPLRRRLACRSASLSPRPAIAARPSLRNPWPPRPGAPRRRRRGQRARTAPTF